MSSSHEAISKTIVESETRIKLEVAREYSIGRMLTLVAANETDASVALEIVEPLKVKNGRRSQVVIAKLIHGVLRGGKNSQSIITEGSTIVAKFYDAECGSTGWNEPHKPALLCKHSKDAEKHAYNKLVCLQGSHIPEFYGEYHSMRAEMVRSDVVPVLLLNLFLIQC
jgi:hypothetical protein